ncbi:MAG: phosphotransferase family protein [Hyphomonadaceae bacterium]
MSTAKTADPAAIARTLSDILTRAAPEIEAGAAGIDKLVRLSGGASQETWAFELIGPQGAKRMIFRRPPPGARPDDPAAGPELESQVIAAAAKAGVPVPHIRLLMSQDKHGTRGYVMDSVPGETLARRIIRDDVYAPARARFSQQVGEIFAGIHRADYSGIQGLRHVKADEAVAVLEGRYRRTQCPRPVFELALAWLKKNLPPTPERPVLVHGDFRNGNLIFGPEGVRAVIDWEGVHIGDPMEDLAWVCVTPWRFGALDKPVGGVGELEDMFAAYEAAAGRPVDRAAVRFWETYGSLKWGVMCASMVEWVRTGEDASIERVMIARRASENEIDLLRLLTPLV